MHVQKKSHKEAQKKLTGQNRNEGDTVRGSSYESKSSKYYSANDDQSSNLSTYNSVSSINDCESNATTSRSQSLASETVQTDKSSNMTTLPVQDLKTLNNSKENVPLKKQENIIQMVYVTNSAVDQMKELLERSESRIQHEAEIIATLSHFFIKIDSTLKVVPFGSSTFGFGSLRTNFNILLKISSSKKNASLECFTFFFNLFSIFFFNLKSR